MALLRSILSRWILIAGAVAAAASLAALAGRWWWCFELCTHFRPHYAVPLAASAAVCRATKHRWFATAFFAGAACNLALVLPLYLPSAGAAASNSPVRLLLANVHVHNRQHELILRLVADTSPDILVVLEVDATWINALEGLAASYPHRVSHPRNDSFGIAVYSRLPADAMEVRWIGKADVPSVVAKFKFGSSGEFHLIATHPLPPVNHQYSAARNEQLAAVAELVRSLPAPKILVGDLNTTSWSPYFRDLLATSGLCDSRRGWGIQPTWPSSNTWLGVPIDHVLVSTDVGIVRRKVGPQIGSDHRPVLVDFVVPQPAASRE